MGSLAMKRTRYSVVQIVVATKQNELGTLAAEIVREAARTVPIGPHDQCRQHASTPQKWRQNSR